MSQWRPQQLQQFPELRFTYEEEASPEDFFVPYVWTLVVAHCGLPWNLQHIALFSPAPVEVDSASSADLGEVTLLSQASGSDLDLAGKV
jgi:dymeclin